MAIQRDTVRRALRAFVMKASGLPDECVIWDHQNVPRPGATYAVLNDWVALARVGMDDEQRITADGVITHVGQRRLTVSVNVYGAGAKPTAAAIHDGLARYDCRALLDQADLAVIGRGEPRDLTALMDAVWEERSQLDLIFGLVASDAEVVGWIQSVEVAAEYNAGGDPPTEIETIITIGGV